MSLVDYKGRRAELDTAAAGYNEGYIVNIGLEHHKIHEGVHYFCCDYDAEVDIAGPKYWHFLAPDSLYRCHLNFFLSASLPGLITAYHAVTLGAVGAALTVDNNDMNITAANTALVYKDPTVTLEGTLFFCQLLGSEGLNPVGAGGGIAERGKEKIIKQDESVLIKFLPFNDATQVAIDFEWYEVPPVADDGT